MTFSWLQIDYTDALSELRSIRESGMRDSARVVDLWYHRIAKNASRLGHEKWLILEQIFIAALDVADDSLAQYCLDQLREKFANSSRVNRLFGMYLERNGKFDAAHSVYTQLIEDDPTNMLARKRLIAILKAQRKTVEAIEELRQYLKIFMSDFEAWSELADLYLGECDYKHAAFCVEELLLSNPHNHLYCQRYAEIKYTEGGTENLELARTYFAQACGLSPGNLRNLYGLLLSCSALDSHSGVVREKGDHPVPIESKLNSQRSTTFPCSVDSLDESLSGPERTKLLGNWAAKQISRLYQDAFVNTDCCSDTSLNSTRQLSAK